jgi:hypothetical protein
VSFRSGAFPSQQVSGFIAILFLQSFEDVYHRCYRSGWFGGSRSARLHRLLRDHCINRELAILRRAFTLAMREDPSLVQRPP